jgi:hypothetical protein
MPSYTLYVFPQGTNVGNLLESGSLADNAESISRVTEYSDVRAVQKAAKDIGDKPFVLARNGVNDPTGPIDVPVPSNPTPPPFPPPPTP